MAALSPLLTVPRLASLSAICDELLLLILRFLDIPDLLALSRVRTPPRTTSAAETLTCTLQTSQHLRALARDPLLHAYRLHRASARLSEHLPQRPSLSSLRPPSGRIYLSQTHILARSVSRQLISISLKRSLSRRPPASSLVEHNILPEACYGRGKGGLAPGLVGAKRSVERERVKDSLRGWLEGKRERVERERQSGRGEEERSVRGLVRRFTAWRGAAGDVPPAPERTAAGSGSAEVRVRQARWVPASKRPRDEPTRAHVLGLRRFWEGLANGQGVKG